ncbi:MAG: amidophosphoribosyltransferase [Actinomycetes bacterium]|jgi:amidophosphoribosyltransferase|nr:amidophosphoribosyltransferase [Actinomycetes bacterium]
MCGVFGAFAPDEDVARLTYFGLHALQHRGQESAGIAVGDGKTVMAVKNLGLVAQVFKESDLQSLPGKVAIGHTRYSTTGSSRSWDNAQPHLSSIGWQQIALAHNGNLVNLATLRSKLTDHHVALRSSSDSEAIAALIGEHTEATSHIREGIRATMETIRGAYAVVLITEEALYAFRDPLGIRPLCIGTLPDGKGWVVASETTALDIVGADYLRDVTPGEVIKVSEDGVETLVAVTEDGEAGEVNEGGEDGRDGQGGEDRESGESRRCHRRRALCIFEYVYFARPDSEMAGLSMYEARTRMGERLAAEAPAEADVVIGVPDSGTPGAVGFAKASGIPFGEGLAKNRYVGRTFIQPSQSLRQRGIRLKLNPMRHAIEGKRVIVVDDSIVRGNTTRALIAMLREFGAGEVHMRITSPPVAWPCYFGIDIDTRAQLIGANRTIDEICAHVGADSLAYLSIDGMVDATGMSREDFCLACFDGNYPLDVSENLVAEEGLESRG